MTITDDDTVRRSLALAVQVLEELPFHLRPVSDIADMRDMLRGETTGRDGYIAAEAVATALAFRSRNAMTAPLHYDKDLDAATVGRNNRFDELRALFELVQRIDPRAFAIEYEQACARLGRAAQGGRL